MLVTIPDFKFDFDDISAYFKKLKPAYDKCNAEHQAQYNALFPKKTLFKRLKRNSSEASEESKPSKADEGNLLVGVGEEEEDVEQEEEEKEGEGGVGQTEIVQPPY